MTLKDVHVICIQDEYCNTNFKHGKSDHKVGTKSTLSDVILSQGEYDIKLKHHDSNSSYGYFANIVNGVILLPYANGKHALYVLDMSEEDKFQASLDGTLHSDFTCVTSDVNVDITNQRQLCMHHISSHIMHDYVHVHHEHDDD